MSWWDKSAMEKARDAHVRKARRALTFSKDQHCDNATRRIWTEHAKQHVKAARRENWLLVGRSRSISAAFFLRKTIGAQFRAHAR